MHAADSWHVESRSSTTGNFNIRFFFHHSFIVFFLSVPNQVEKLRKFQGWWGVFQAPPGIDIPGVVGGSKAKMPSMGGYGYFLEPHILSSKSVNID